MKKKNKIKNYQLYCLNYTQKNRNIRYAIYKQHDHALHIRQTDRHVHSNKHSFIYIHSVFSKQVVSFESYRLSVPEETKKKKKHTPLYHHFVIFYFLSRNEQLDIRAYHHYIRPNELLMCD